MDFLEMLNQAGLFAKLSLLLGFGPLAVAAVYLFRPTEWTLALLRPLSLASIFGALAGVIVGFISVLTGMAAVGDRLTMTNVYAGASEALVPGFFNFGLLAVSWVMITIGMLRRRQP